MEGMAMNGWVHVYSDRYVYLLTNIESSMYQEEFPQIKKR